MRTDTQSEASKMKGIEVCEAGDFRLGFSNNHFRKRMTAMYVNPISVVFQKKKKTFTILCAKNSTFYLYPSKDAILSLSCQLSGSNNRGCNVPITKYQILLRSALTTWFLR